MVIDTMCFADFDPVTGVPTMDGFTGIEDAGVITAEAEPGYVNGSRLNLGSAGAGTGSGFPPAVVQAVRNGDFLHLSFFCRFDFSFDDSDVIVLAVKPSLASPQTDARRIDIFPVFNGIGADDVLCGGGHCPDDPQKPGEPNNSNYRIRGNHPPRTMKHFKGDGASGWTSISYTGPTNLTVSVRSWKPPVPATCEEAAWSVEVKLPRTTAAAAGGASWINLNDSFALYFNIFRVIGCTHAVCPGACALPTAVVQYRFPTNTAALTGVIGAATVIPGYGTGFIPALQMPVGSNCGKGVEFVNDNDSVGVRPTTAAAGTAPGWIIQGPSGTSDNRLVAQVHNTGLTAADDAPGVTAEFRFANWGLGPAGFAAWAPASGAAPMPSTPTNVPHGGGQVELTSEWPRASVPAAYSSHPHQCVWVQLDTHQLGTPVDVNFVQSSTRRNMDFVNLSEVNEPAEISGVGYEPPTSGPNHEFYLITNVRKIVVPGRGTQHLGTMLRAPDPKGPSDPTTYWVWIVHGYRRTGQSIEIEGRTFEILDDTPGAFGHIASHQGRADDVFTSRLAGGGIGDRGNGIYTLPVPHDGSVTINTHVAAGPAPKGCLAWLLTQLPEPTRALLNLLRRLFG